MHQIRYSKCRTGRCHQVCLWLVRRSAYMLVQSAGLSLSRSLILTIFLWNDDNRSELAQRIVMYHE